MEEKMQNNEEGLSLIQIIRVLLDKIKLLILVVLIGGICGGAFGIWRTIDMKYYGTSIEFYVNPEKPTNVGNSSNLTANAVGSQYGVYGAYGRHVMDAIVKLLSSESFTEQLMLEENGLPSTELYPNLDETKYVNAENALKKAEAAWKKAAEFDAPLAEALDNLNDFWIEAGLSGTFSESGYNNLISKQEFTIPSYLKDAYEHFRGVNEQRNDAIQKATTVQKDSDAIVEILLEEWREHPQYVSTLDKFQGAVKYSYLGDNEDIEDANNLARSFLYVNINVLNDEEFAKDLLIRVKRAVPEYVEKNMIVPTDYEGTSCTRITRTDDIRRTNPHYRRNQSIKYAVLAAAAAGVIAAVLIIILDAQDKRLRDYEVVSKMMDVPVLGIIPTIDEMNQTIEMKKQQNKGGH